MKNVRQLFQKISPFDLALVLIVVVLGLSFFFFFYRKAEYVNIRIKVTDQDVLYQRTDPKNWYANRFFKGDAEPDALGRKITEIVGIESFNVASDQKAVYLDLRVRSTYDTRTKLYYARGKPLIFGSPMRFNLSSVTFDGFVTEFPGSDKQQDLKIGTTAVNALARSIEPKVAESIKKGDQIFDSNKMLLAEIKDIRVMPAERVTQTAAGELLLRSDPLFKDVVITAEVRTKTIHGETFVFDNLPLKIGSPLPLNFDKVSIFPLITDFKPESS